MTIWADVPFLLVLVIITVLLGPCISTDDTALADRTNGRAYVAVLSVCLSVVCNVCIVAKRCVLAKNCLKKQTGCLAYGELNGFVAHYHIHNYARATLNHNT